VVPNIHLLTSKMPNTRSKRSFSTLARSTMSLTAAMPPRSPRNSKRKTQDTDAAESSSPSQNPKKPRVLPLSTEVNTVLSSARANPFLPAVLSFSFDVAKNHLIDADSRFKGIFEKLPCRPFEHLDRVDPFRSAISRSQYVHDTKTTTSTAFLR